MTAEIEDFWRTDKKVSSCHALQPARAGTPQPCCWHLTWGQTRQHRRRNFFMAMRRLREPQRMAWFQVQLCGWCAMMASALNRLSVVLQLRTLAPPVASLLRDLGDALGTLFMLSDTSWRHSRMLVANNMKNAQYGSTRSGFRCYNSPANAHHVRRHGHPTALLTPYKLRLKYEVNSGDWDVYKLAAVSSCLWAQLVAPGCAFKLTPCVGRGASAAPGRAGCTTAPTQGQLGLGVLLACYVGVGGHRC